MNYTLEEYLEDTKRHLNYFQTDDELKEYYNFDYTFQEILENKEYFESCLNKGISTYKALLFFEDYLKKDKSLWDNYKNSVGFSSNPYDRKFEIIEYKKGFSDFKIGDPYSFDEFFKMLEIDNNFRNRWNLNNKIDIE